MRCGQLVSLALSLLLAKPGGARELHILTRQGAIERFTDGKKETLPVAVKHPRDLTVLPGGFVALGERLEVYRAGHRKLLSTPTAKLRLVAGGSDATGKRQQIFGILDDGGIVSIDVQTGQTVPRPVTVSHPTAAVACGERLFVSAGTEIVEIDVHDGVRRHALPGHPIAIAASGNKIYAATREGPLFELDRESGAWRDLGLGGWWGTLALASDGAHLYAATQSGKLWEIDPIGPTKTILEMDGRAATLAIAPGSPPACP